MDIKEQITAFHKRQKDFYGYVKYRVRSETKHENKTYFKWYYVDALMKNGLVIKTCKCNLVEKELLKYIEQINGEMKHD